MSSAWLLPEHIADVLPAQARSIEELRRAVIDAARRYGFELVMPPLLEHVESLLTGATRALDLNTFKLVDQLSGRTLGLRADSTPQVARIDAHLLNRAGVTRLCYCGPVLHALPSDLHSTREPLQFGVEIYGHAGLQADLEVLELALDSLGSAGVSEITLDLGDARIVRGALAGVPVGPELLAQVYAALAAKDVAALRSLSADFPDEARRAVMALPAMYGDAEVLAIARRDLPPRPLIQAALDDLQWLLRQLAQSHPDVKVGFDLADIGTSGYYTGTRFAAFVSELADAVVRGGRYDEVGAVFGRNRPAVGFSLDVKVLAACAAKSPTPTAIRAPWNEDAELRESVRRLRRQGETVVHTLADQPPDEGHEFAFDRELVRAGAQWIVRPVSARLG